ELRRAGDVSGGCVAAVLSRDRKAYWVDPRDAELARDLDAWLAEREADGLLPAVRARYGLEPAAGGADALLSPAPARVADLVGRRLLLMPLVAEAKRARGAQVEDLGREAVVERRAADAACAAASRPSPTASSRARRSRRARPCSAPSSRARPARAVPRSTSTATSGPRSTAPTTSCARSSSAPLRSTPRRPSSRRAFAPPPTCPGWTTRPSRTSQPRSPTSVRGASRAGRPRDRDGRRP